MNETNENVSFEESYQKKDIHKMLIKSLIVFFAVILLTILFIIKPQMVNKITRVYYIISIISVLIMGSLVCFVFKYLSTKKHLKVVKVYDGISDFFAIFALACVIIQSFFVFGFSRHEVVGNSMAPTLVDGQKIIRKSTTKFENGMVIVANYSDKINIPYERPSNITDGELVVKRIIGKGGDAFTYEEKEINGIKVIYLAINDELISYGVEAKEKLECYLKHGVRYDEETNTYVIMDGYYFLMGDNRQVSADSRILGLFTEEQLFGQVIYYYDSFWDWKKIS